MKKVILITGASRGIGRAIAKKAGSQGYSVAINYRNNEKEAQSILKELIQSGVEAITIQADISQEEDILRMFAEVKEKLGPLTAFVNNAGIITTISKLEAMDAKRIENVLKVNVLGSILCAREAIKAMSTMHGGQGGSIVNLSSAAAKLGSPNEFVDYAASKGAIDSFTIGLAKEVAREGIRVNAIRPGLIETEMQTDTGDPQRIERLKGGVPLQREGAAKEVADAVMYLLSNEASYITGSILDVTGGR